MKNNKILFALFACSLVFQATLSVIPIFFVQQIIDSAQQIYMSQFN